MLGWRDHCLAYAIMAESLFNLLTDGAIIWSLLFLGKIIARLML